MDTEPHMKSSEKVQGGYCILAILLMCIENASKNKVYRERDIKYKDNFKNLLKNKLFCYI